MLEDVVMVSSLRYSLGDDTARFFDDGNCIVEVVNAYYRSLSSVNTCADVLYHIFTCNLIPLLLVL